MASAVIDAARRGADPARAMRRAVSAQPPRATRPALLAIGKAASAMREGLGRAELAPSLLITADGVEAPAIAIRGDHPIPGARSRQAGLAVAAFVERLRASNADGLVVLLSGGASALACLPRDPIAFDDYARLTRRLLGDGRVTIRELNAVRRQCERLKGGELAAALAPIPCDVYTLSDVIGDDPAVIASGPFSPCPGSALDAIAIIERSCGREFEPITRALRQLAPKPAGPFAHVRTRVIANHETALAAAADALASRGFELVERRPGVEGEASRVGAELGKSARALGPSQAIAWAGETTVTLGDSPGTGGRNQELALAAALEIAGDRGLTLVAFATDGRDGPTDAAGAIVDAQTLARARGLRLDPRDHLARHDAYPLLDRLGALIRTGPSGTNVNDVAIAFRAR